MGLETSTLLAIGAITSAVGTVGSGVLSFQQARQQWAVQRQQAERARLQADIDAKEFRRRQIRLLGQARAIRGSTGVDLLTGSPLLVDDDTINEIVFQTENIRRNGQVQATRLEQQASLTRTSGSAALASSVFLGGGSLLTSGAFGSGKSSPASDPLAIHPG